MVSFNEHIPENNKITPAQPTNLSQESIDSTMVQIFCLANEPYRNHRTASDLESLKKEICEFQKNEGSLTELCRKVHNCTGISLGGTTDLIQNNFDSLCKILNEKPPNEPPQISSIPTDEIPKTSGQTDVFDINHINWSATRTVSSSSEGVGGVWFYNSANVRLAVKRDSMHQQQAFATRFLKAAGFRPPDLRLVPRNSEEGQKIIQLCEKHANNPTYNLKQRPALSRGEGAFCVMTFVKGSSATNLSKFDKATSIASYKNIAQTPQFSEEIGKIVIFDRLINNVDRFNENGLNEGNIMIDENGLVPIDQSAFVSIKRTHFSELEETVNELFSNQIPESLNYSKKISNLFYNKTQIRLSPESIAIGMKQAVKDIAKNADYYKNILSQIDAEIVKECNVQTSKMTMKNPMSTLKFIEKGIITIKETWEGLQ